MDRLFPCEGPNPLKTWVSRPKLSRNREDLDFVDPNKKKR